MIFLNYVEQTQIVQFHLCEVLGQATLINSDKYQINSLLCRK